MNKYLPYLVLVVIVLNAGMWVLYFGYHPNKISGDDMNLVSLSVSILEVLIAAIGLAFAILAIFGYKSIKDASIEIAQKTAKEIIEANIAKGFEGQNKSKSDVAMKDLAALTPENVEEIETD